MINLKEVITKYPECLESASKLRSYLVDLYPNEKRNITIITTIFDCGIAGEIKNTNGVVEEFKIASYCNRLENDYAYSPKFTKECLNLWIEAYSITKKQPVIKNDDAKKEIKKAKTATIKTGVSETKKPKYSKGLEIEDGVLVGIGTCKDIDIIIPHGITAIGKKAFMSCKSLKSIKIPTSVTSIERHAFNGCVSLTNILIPDTIKTIGKCAFTGCKNLISLDVPSNIVNIENGLCAGCENLSNILIPENVSIIGVYAFSSCRSLESIIIPNNVTYIGNNAFHSCTNLTNVTIDNDEINIGRNAFDGCKKLKFESFSSIIKTKIENSKVLEKNSKNKKKKKKKKNDYINPDDVVFEEKATDLDFLEAIKSIEETKFVIGQKFLTQIVSITEEGLLVSIPNKKKEQLIRCENLINDISNYKKGDNINVSILKLSPFTLIEIYNNF